MKELIISLLLVIIVMGITFWAMNNPNGVGSGLDQGAIHLKNKILEATQ
jgi:hypothetical protein